MHQQNLIRRDGEAVLWRQWAVEKEKKEMLQQLYHQLNWRQDSIQLFGKSHPLPRLQCWYGEPHCTYKYSKLLLKPQPLPPLLKSLKDEIQKTTNLPFNCVLANLYRNGNDTIGWHADNEHEFGQNPNIASLSFGATRQFVLRHQIDQERISIWLQDGDLLLMKQPMQRHWQHHIPRTKKVDMMRINLTFRYIPPADALPSVKSQ